MNNTQGFSINQAFKEGWEGTKKNFLFLVGLVLITCGLSLVPGLLGSTASDIQEESGFSLIISLIGWLVQILLAMGTIKIALTILAGQKPSYRLLIPETNKIVPFVVTSIIYASIVTLGFIVVIIPGIYFTLKYQFYSYRLIDTNDGIVDALRQSGELTRGVKWQLLGFMLLLVVMNMLGALAILVGLFVTIPVTLLATASVYRQLSNRFMPALQGEVKPAAQPAPTAPAPVPPTV